MEEENETIESSYKKMNNGGDSFSSELNADSIHISSEKAKINSTNESEYSVKKQPIRRGREKKLKN